MVRSINGGWLLYTIKKTWDKVLEEYGKDKNKFPIVRTIYQKISYFVLPSKTREKLFVPYRYGPYSADIQAIATYFEREPEAFADLKGPQEIKQRVEKVIRFLIKRNYLTAQKISSLAKVDFLILKGYKEPVLIKKKSLLLGWEELSGESKSTIQSLIQTVRKLRGSVPYSRFEHSIGTFFIPSAQLQYILQDMLRSLHCGCLQTFLFFHLSFEVKFLKGFPS